MNKFILTALNRATGWELPHSSPMEPRNLSDYQTNLQFYSAELRALLLALELIEGSTKKHFIIFSDSLSAMQALKNPHPDHPLVGEILSWHTNITVHLELSIFFCWVPGHIGIRGNEQVDDLAKLAVNLDSSEEPMLFKDLKPSINEHLTNIWQNRWSQSSPNKFLEIVPDLKGWKVPSLQQTRKDEVIMCRSRLGHARLTHSYLLMKTLPNVFTVLVV